MFETIERDADERGQVGIGTLIVFIALVLVAAIAAGVLINTAGFLQNQAESTGEESTQQVSNNLEVLSATGAFVSGSAPVDKVTLTVGVGPGSDPVDLEDTDIQYLNDTATSFQGADGGDASITFQATDGSDPSDNVISSGERLQIVFDLDEAASTTFGGGTLTEGEEAEVQLTTADGSQTTVVLNVPDPLDGTDAVRL